MTTLKRHDHPFEKKAVVFVWVRARAWVGVPYDYI